MKLPKLLSMSILIASALLLCAASSGSAQAPNQPRIKKTEKHAIPQNSPTNTPSDQRGTEKMPLAVKLLNTGKSQQEAAQEAAQIKEGDNTDWWIVRLAVVAAGIGLLQFIAFVWQGYVLNRTLLASELALHADRPVLVLEQIVPSIRDWSGAKPFIRAEVHFRNVGKSPALITKARAALRVHHRSPLDVEAPDLSTCFRAGVESPIIQPNTVGIIDVGNALELSPNEIDQVRRSQWTIIAYGETSYRDPAFDKEYPMRFCWLYKTPRTGFPHGSFIVGYEEHQFSA